MCFERGEKWDCSTDRSTYASITVKRISEDFVRRNGIFLVDFLLLHRSVALSMSLGRNRGSQEFRRSYCAQPIGPLCSRWHRIDRNFLMDGDSTAFSTIARESEPRKFTWRWSCVAWAVRHGSLRNGVVRRPPLYWVKLKRMDWGRVSTNSMRIRKSIPIDH